MSSITKEFTKEQLQQIEAAAKEVMWPVVWSEKKAREHFSEKITPKVVLKLARIALASLESGPVAWRHFQETPTDGGYWILNDYKPNCSGVEPLYTAPQAPISVPDLTALDNLAGEMLNHAMNCERRVAVVYTHCAHRLAEEVRDLRAAMLQGAEPVTTDYKLRDAVEIIRNSGIEIDAEKIFAERDALDSPVIPDGWVACSERMPENDDFVYIWPRPDFGVELHVAQYGKFDKRDAGWYAQVYEQNYGIEYYPVKVTHWMTLPAAPQQEVK
ncbi:DUF551 domain-containing protein [Enterobacter bugandensis]|uniref:DUF551 domain-containing protein n=1 Tax=Enterobacter bugandensis TaxID=881260 RepID=UPI001E413052|nr:DUF551 domain-containing protein [Enterobacter bugandensis]MCE2006796.1 DUF551 domain-containing protein [Enterobacter bugandensis]